MWAQVARLRARAAGWAYAVKMEMVVDLSLCASKTPEALPEGPEAKSAHLAPAFLKTRTRSARCGERAR